MNWAMDQAMYRAMNGTLYKAVSCAVYNAAWWDVSRAVYRAVYGAVNGAVCHDPPHPALRDFLAEVDQGAA
jgi:hypothetical protein